MSAVDHSKRCLEVALQMRPLFDLDPASTERIAAHGLFLRCIDHFRAAVLLGEQGLDVEAMSLIRGISESMFVMGALLLGFLTTKEFEAFDRAQKAKNAREMKMLLEEFATPELQAKMRDYVEQYIGPSDLKLQQLAIKIGQGQYYDGHYRMFSHVATHPSNSAIRKYFQHGDQGTVVLYPGIPASLTKVVLLASSAILHVCACLEKWLGRTPATNVGIHNLLLEQKSFGSPSKW